MNDLEEITPEDSLVPVFLDTTPIDTSGGADPIALMEADTAARESAVEEIMAGGYSENTARIMAGLPPLPV